MTRRTLFLIALLFELIAVFGLFLPYEYRMNTGTKITLETVPVDPSSIFRGSYVTLNYVVGSGAPKGWAGELQQSPDVYVTLAAKGDIYERVTMGKEKPTNLEAGQVCLHGYADQWSGFFNFPDIGQYFTDETLAKELEAVRNDRRLLVDAVVDRNCKATITGVHIGQSVAPEQAERERNEVFSPTEPPVEKPIPMSAE